MHLSASSPRVVSRRVNVYSPVLTRGHPPPGPRGRRLASTSSFLLSSWPINQFGRARPFADKVEPPPHRSTVIVPWLAPNLVRDATLTDRVLRPRHAIEDLHPPSWPSFRYDTREAIPRTRTTHTGRGKAHRTHDLNLRTRKFTGEHVSFRPRTLLGSWNPRDSVPRTRHTKPADLPQRPATRCLRIPVSVPLASPSPAVPTPPQQWNSPSPSSPIMVARSFHPPSRSLITHSCPFLAPLPHSHPPAAPSNSGSMKPILSAWTPSLVLGNLSTPFPFEIVATLSKRSLSQFDQYYAFRQLCFARVIWRGLVNTFHGF